MTSLEPLDDPNVASGERRRFLPYPPHSLEPILPLEVRRIEVDEQDVTTEAIVAARCRIRPHVVHGWHRVRIEFALADFDDAIWSRAFPEAEELAVRHILRIRCPASRLRRAARLDRREDGYHGVVELSRDDVERSVQIEGAAVRARPARTPIPHRANEQFSWLARSPRWLVEVDATDMPAGGAFDFAWVDFGKPEASPQYRNEDAGYLVQCPDALSHVVIRPSGPLLLVNKRHESVVGVLSAKGTVGTRARLRDVLLNRIAVEAWRTILCVAVADVTNDSSEDGDEAADLGDEHWTTAVLRHAAKVAKVERDEIVRRIAGAETRPGFLFHLAETLGRVGSETLRKLVDEVEST